MTDILTALARRVDELELNHVLRNAESMQVFCDGEQSFVYGAWKEWRAACQAQQRLIPPAEFKAARALQKADTK